MRAARWPWIAAALGLLAIGCDVLPEIEHGSCGNRVVELGESCDGFPEGDAPCRSPSEPLACHLDCSLRADGRRPACPAGWGCAVDDICREATGAYRAPTDPVLGDAVSLLTGDFDGDGRGDVVSVGAPGLLEAAKFRVHYFDREGQLERSWTSPRSPTSLVIDDVSSDTASDLLFSDYRIGVLLGQASGDMISATYPTYFLPGAKLRMITDLYPATVDGISSLAVIAEQRGAFVMYRPDFASESLLPIANFAGTIADLAGEPVAVDLFEDDQRYPCRDVAFALRGGRAISLYSLCERDAETGAVRWRATPEITEIRLSPKAAIERGPLFADMDADGHLDLLVGAGGRLYVAFGDGQRLGPAEPFTGDVDNNEAIPLVMPIAAGDFTGDGAADLVYPSGLFLSRRHEDADRLRYSTAFSRLNALWTDARIVDLNGNGLLDVVAASNRNLDIDFFNGTGGDRLATAVLPTTRPIDHLAVGDLDGDLISDLAYTLSGPRNDEREVAVAFGSPAGPPAAGVTVASASSIQQVGTLLNTDADALGQLFIAYEQTDDAGERGSALAWLVGSGDRSLACLIELTSFASDGSLESVPALGLVTGAFTAPDRRDAVVLGSRLLPGDSRLWLLPDLRSQRGRPVLLRSELDAIAPISGLGRGAEPHVELSMAAGDVDGDGLDELVIATSDAEGAQCQLLTARVAPRQGFELQTQAQVALDQPCARGVRPIVRDLDGDGAVDIVLLLGADDERVVRVLWNEGDGGFAADEATTLVEAERDTRAFALFNPSPDAALALAYVTPSEAHVLRAGTRPRTFLDTKLDLELEQGTGIAASDVDGDGIVDLLLADGGNIRVLRAELAP